MLEIKNEHIQTIKVDFTNKDAAKTVHNFIGDRPIDILINNAAMFPYNASMQPLDWDTWLECLVVNSMQSVNLSLELQDNVAKSEEKKIIGISSQMGVNSLTIKRELKGRYG